MITPGAHIHQNMGHIYHCGFVDDDYLSPYLTRAKWFSRLLRKSRALALGPLSYNFWSQKVAQVSHNMWHIRKMLLMLCLNTLLNLTLLPNTTQSSHSLVLSCLSNYPIQLISIWVSLGVSLHMIFQHIVPSQHLLIID